MKREKIILSEDYDTYFSSDHHFCHENVLKHDNRPFEGVDEMNKELIRLWNNTVDEDDIVYYLGDLTLGKQRETEKIVKQLNGKIRLIYGNHDKSIKSNVDIQDYFEWTKHYYEINVMDGDDKNYHVILCHYPIFSWNRAHYGSIMLHGHSHHNLNYGPLSGSRIIDVGVDGWDYRPVHIETILEEISELEHKSVDHH